MPPDKQQQFERNIVTFFEDWFGIPTTIFNLPPNDWSARTWSFSLRGSWLDDGLPLTWTKGPWVRLLVQDVVLYGHRCGGRGSLLDTAGPLKASIREVYLEWIIDEFRIPSGGSLSHLWPTPPNSRPSTTWGHICNIRNYWKQAVHFIYSKETNIWSVYEVLMKIMIFKQKHLTPVDTL